MEKLDVLVRGLDFGEALRWHDGRLWYSDFFRRGVFAATLEGEEEHIVALDDMASGIGWLPDGRLLVVSMRSRNVLRREVDGSLVLHADLSALASGPCNDMVVASDGTAYVGNFGFDVYVGEDDYAPAAVLRVTPEGAVSIAADDFAFPNGSVITPDGTTLIVGESMARQYSAFAIEADGSLSGRRVWATLDASPDGCTLDAEGAIWAALASAGQGGGAGQVLRVKEGGEITHRITFPQGAYACALGGEDGCTLFVTTAPGAMPDEVEGKGLGVICTTRVDVPHAGRP